jgi:hypothetical protein
MMIALFCRAALELFRSSFVIGKQTM